MKIKNIVLATCLSFACCLNLAAEKYDFGDYSSQVLIKKATKAYDQKNWKALKIYAQKCIHLYTSHAKRMQKKLYNFPGDNESMEYWALNHVAYAHFLLAQMYDSKGNIDKAYKEYGVPVKKYKFSKCFDPDQNIFWKIADACISKQKYLKKNQNNKKFKQKKLRPLPKIISK